MVVGFDWIGLDWVFDLRFAMRIVDSEILGCFMGCGSISLNIGNLILVGGTRGLGLGLGF